MTALLARWPDQDCPGAGTKGTDSPPALDVFALRAWAGATLWQAAVLSLQEAVDTLQDFAEMSGLVDRLGQDQVQAVLRDAFHRVRRAAAAPPGGRAEIHSRWFSGRAAESTLEALMFSLRERGDAALTEPDSRRRLAQLSTAQVRSVIARLIAARSRYPAITDQLLLLLGEQLS
jgi:hypothetical protein